MAWRQLAVTCPGHLADAVAGAMEEAGAQAVSLEDAAQGALFEPAPGEHPLWERARVCGLLAANVASESVQALVEATVSRGMLGEWVLTDLTEENWLERSRREIQSRCFGGRLWVCPPWAPAPPPGSAVLRLEPGLAFGSGSHETTALCLEWLAVQDLAGRVVVDYGCGSGILALAAVALGARRVHAVDHDPQALVSTRENARRNDMLARVTACAEAGLPDGPCADVLLANILANPLVALAPRLAGLLRDGGRLALSGVLDDQVGTVWPAYAPWFDGFRCHSRGGWSRIEGTRRARA